MNLFAVATVGALGCNLGSAVAYAVGRHGGRRAVERWGKYVLLTRDDLARADWFFDRFGGAAVLIARMLPVVRTFIALPAGISAMPLVRFHVYTFVGSWPWCFLLAYLGMVLGDKWGSDPRMAAVFHYADYAIAVLIVSLSGALSGSAGAEAAKTPNRTRPCPSPRNARPRGSRPRGGGFSAPRC